MNNLNDLFKDLNEAWKNVEQNLNNLNLESWQKEWKQLFESPNVWWKKLPPEWQQVLKMAVRILDTKATPTDTQLKQMLALNKLDCSDAPIVSLEPIRNLKNLQEIDFSNTNVVNLEPLQSLPNLLKINASNTQITDLKPLKKLKNLRALNFSMTDVDDLKPLRKLNTLKEIDCHATFIKRLSDLDELDKIQLLNCENTPLKAQQVKRFQRRHPQAQVVFTFPEPRRRRRWLW
jgi:Leucine-rich repeat (LRR) protein